MLPKFGDQWIKLRVYSRKSRTFLGEPEVCMRFLALEDNDGRRLEVKRVQHLDWEEFRGFVCECAEDYDPKIDKLTRLILYISKGLRELSRLSKLMRKCCVAVPTQF